jgi:hypothetical protein
MKLFNLSKQLYLSENSKTKNDLEVSSEDFVNCEISDDTRKIITNGISHNKDNIILEGGTIDSTLSIIDDWMNDKINSVNDFTDLSFPTFVESEKKSNERLKSVYLEKRSKRNLKKEQKKLRVQKALDKKNKINVKKERYVKLVIEIIKNAKIISCKRSRGLPTFYSIDFNLNNHDYLLIYQPKYTDYRKEIDHEANWDYDDEWHDNEYLYKKVPVEYKAIIKVEEKTNHYDNGICRYEVSNKQNERIINAINKRNKQLKNSKIYYMFESFKLNE